jgi:hypothetical protein
MNVIKVIIVLFIVNVSLSGCKKCYKCYHTNWAIRINVNPIVYDTICSCDFSSRKAFESHLDTLPNSLISNFEIKLCEEDIKNTPAYCIY